MNLLTKAIVQQMGRCSKLNGPIRILRIGEKIDFYVVQSPVVVLLRGNIIKIPKFYGLTWNVTNQW